VRFSWDTESSQRINIDILTHQLQYLSYLDVPVSVPLFTRKLAGVDNFSKNQNVDVMDSVIRLVLLGTIDLLTVVSFQENG
jgi:hypothetical protein